MRVIGICIAIGQDASREDHLNRRDVRMVALRAALVAVVLAAMVATFLALALLARRNPEGTAHAGHAGVADARSINTEVGGRLGHAEPAAIAIWAQQSQGRA